MEWLSALALLVSLEASQPSARSPNDAGTVNGWSIRDDRGHCSAFTSYAGRRFVLLRYDAARNSAHLSVSDPVWRSIENNRVYQVRILFDNGSEYPAGDAVGLNVSGETSVTGLNFHLAADEFLRDFAGAGAFGLFMDDIRLGAFSLRGTRAMVTRLRACAAVSNRRHPRDPFEALAATSARPGEGTMRQGPPIMPPVRMGASRARANLNSYFSTDDYPAAATRERAEGTTAFQLTVNASGRVADCVITMTSGSTALDETTCRILRSRARYTPARDAGGNPTAGTDSGRVTWRLPVEPPAPAAETPLPVLPDTDPNPSRVWVQIATAPNREELERQYRALRARAAGSLSGRRLWVGGADALRRGLIGPFESAHEAREFIARLQTRNIPASIWISQRSEAVQRVDAR